MDTLREALPFRMEVGDRFAGKYLIERVLGSGAMGVVVAALHEQLGLRVAIKLLSVPINMRPEGITRFFREARAAAALRSEHIARVVDVDVDELGRHYLVMEHLEGEDLGLVLKHGVALAVSTSVGYVLHACEAIAEAHALGIIHRDLKPENLFLTRRMDESPLIKVLDFGISKILETTITTDDALSVSTTRSLLGTPLYMSPEQLRTPEQIDGRSDVWALGVILFELLTGERPFMGDTLPDIMVAVLTRTAPDLATLRPDIPRALSDVVLGCLEKDLARRTPNVGVLAQRLQPWAPRWARDAAAQAARIAGIAPAMPDETDGSATPVSPEGDAEVLAEVADPPPHQGDHSRVRWMAVGFGVAVTMGLASLITQAIRKPDPRPGGTSSAIGNTPGTPVGVTDPDPAAAKAGMVAASFPDAAAQKSGSIEIQGIGRPGRRPLRLDPLGNRR
jgi:eukaryotic-like serine/threonine-protein kinase